MEIDAVRALVVRQAGLLGVRPPGVVAGAVPVRLPTGGLRLRGSGKRARIVVDPRFGELEPAEQEALLAEHVAGSALMPRFRRMVVTTTVVLLVLVLVVGGASAFLPGVVARVPVLLLLGLYVFVVSWQARRLSYAVDRLVVGAFGWSVIDAGLEFHRRNPFTGFSTYRLSAPTVEQRMARLDRLRGMKGGG